MNPTARTLIFVAVAVASSLIALASWSASRPGDLEGFSQAGSLMFAKFDDPTQAKSLTVTDFDEDSKEAVTFSVRQDDSGLWVIPSHHDYPAEAADRLAKTATSFIGVTKSAIQSLSKDDWKSYGVADPSSDGTADADERGTRVALMDGSGNALVDLIIGNQVEGRTGFYYVRQPEQNPTFVAELDVDLSAKFSDWIEPDLLKIDQSDVVEVTVDNYSVDEQRGVILQGEKLEFAKEELKTTGSWELADLTEEEELDDSPITDIARNLDQLKIVGVRPKPKGLRGDLSVDPLMRQILQQEMQQRGFFIAGGKDGEPVLVSNEGELIAGTGNGVQYTLYFGEIARGTGKDIEIGLEAEPEATDEESEGADEEEEDEDGPRRYLLVKAGFNEDLLGGKPQEPVEPVKPAILEETAGSEEDAKEDGGSEADSDEAKKDEAAEGTESDDTETAGEESEEENADDADDACSPFDEETQEGDAEEATDEASSDEENGKEEDAANPVDDQVADEKPAGEPPTDGEDAPAKDDGEQPKADEPAETEADDKEPAEPQVDPKTAAQQAYDQAMGEYEAQKAAFDRELKTYNEKVEEGQKTAEELSIRFEDWYYVITADSFEKFRIGRKDVVSKKEAEETEEGSETPDGQATPPGN